MSSSRMGWMALIAVAAMTQLCGCLSYNHKKQIAVAFTTDAHGKLDGKALTAALLAKFPVGSPAAPVEELATSLRGKCGPERQGVVSCRIPVSGTLCIAQNMLLQIKTDAGMIVGLDAGVADAYC